MEIKVEFNWLAAADINLHHSPLYSFSFWYFSLREFAKGKFFNFESFSSLIKKKENLSMWQISLINGLKKKLSR